MTFPDGPAQLCLCRQKQPPRLTAYQASGKAQVPCRSFPRGQTSLPRVLVRLSRGTPSQSASRTTIHRPHPALQTWPTASYDEEETTGKFRSFAILWHMHHSDLSLVLSASRHCASACCAPRASAQHMMTISRETSRSRCLVPEGPLAPALDLLGHPYCTCWPRPCSPRTGSLTRRAEYIQKGKAHMLSATSRLQARLQEVCLAYGKTYGAAHPCGTW